MSDGFVAAPELMRSTGRQYSTIGNNLWAAWQRHVATLAETAAMFGLPPDGNAKQTAADYERGAHLIESAIHLAVPGISDVDDAVRHMADNYDAVDRAGARVFDPPPAP